MDSLTSRMLRTWAHNAVAQAVALAEADPSWGSRVYSVSGGWLVLSGPGMYVNQALAVGLSGDLTDEDIAFIVDQCQRMGVQPSCEVTSVMSSGSVARLAAHGFVHDPSDDVTALVRSVPGKHLDIGANFVVRRVEGETDLDLWREVSAASWGRLGRSERAVSDAFVTAAYVTDGDGMMIAFEAESREPVGCSSVTIRDGLATLGGMSTLPDHRRRGAQAELVRQRLLLAAERGCDYAVATCASGSASERNLIGLGFQSAFTVQTWTS